MSRNDKNFKNQPAKFLLKTMFKPSSINPKKFNLSPLNLKNNSNITKTEYLSFYTNESTNKSNKKNLNQNKINCLFRNYSQNKKNTINNNPSKKMTRNNSNEKNLILNKTNIKRCSSSSKTNTNSLNISNNFTKKYKIKEKKSNKILKLFIKEGEKNLSKSKINNSKGNTSKKLIKNKSINNIHITKDKSFLNIKRITNLNDISNINIKKEISNNKKNFAYINKNYYTSNNSSGINSLLHSSKNKIKNLNIAINNIDTNNNIKNNIFNVNTYTHSNISKNIHKKINMNKTCINTPIESFRKKEQIMQLNKEIETKENEINNLKNIINEKDIYIKNLENRVSSLNINKNVDEEYEKYSKIIMLKNVKSLTKENEDLHKQLNEYKNKEIKMMKLLENMNKKGIDINNILNMLDKEEENNIINNPANINEINNSSELNTNERIIKYDEIVLKTDTTNNTNNTNNTFEPLNLNDQQKNISSKSCINLNQNLPVLPLKHINEYFNDNYYVQKENENDNIQIQITNNYDCNIIRNNNNY